MKRASQGLYSLLARADVGTAEASSSSRHGDVQTNTGMDCQLWRSFQDIKEDQEDDPCSQRESAGSHGESTSLSVSTI